MPYPFQRLFDHPRTKKMPGPKSMDAYAIGGPMVQPLIRQMM